ncbi:MAG: tetratricopeptide repeat protein [Aeoliella sp.]
MNRRLILMAAVICLAVDSLMVSAQQNEPTTTAYVDIGNIHHEVSTESEAAQKWFDRGLAMCYGFNHEEAVRCFEKALKQDPGLAMAHWGIAYAWGPNINNMEIEAHQIAKAAHAVHLATLHAEDSTALERDLIDALAKRYTTPVPEDRGPLNKAYTKAMRAVHQKYGNDSPLVVALFAESLMNLQPWKHWSPEGEPAQATPGIVKMLEDGFEKWPDHPALCHFYIHTMEASPHPERALPAANRLRHAVPGSGHLLHMPSHIDVLLGDYEEVIAANQRAIKVDDEFMKREGPYNFYTLYRIHNYHFLVYGAMFDGQSELALHTARKLVDQVPKDMLRDQVDFIDAFMPTTLHVLVRFGKWEEILQEPEPADYLPMSRSIWHYARTLAYAATGRVEEAEEERELFAEAMDEVPETSFLFQNASLHILGVAEAMVDGEIAYRKGDFELAFDHLREAVRRDDALNYDEPWGWMQPARHALGALLIEQNHFSEAEKVYRADLKRHPKNPWALHGLAESLAKQEKGDESAKYRSQFATACERADVKIDRSCYCRLMTEE